MDAFIEEVTLGLWQANCYVLGDRDRGTAVVVDPGQDGVDAVTSLLERNGSRCDAILLTHGHLDHLWSVPELARAFDAPVFLHPDDWWLWSNPAHGFAPRGSAASPAESLTAGLSVLEQQFGLRWDTSGVDIAELGEGDKIEAGGLTFEVRHTPGHTPGSCVFLLRTGEETLPVDADLLLSGDLIFAGSVGRTDLPRGSSRDLLTSIDRAVMTLDDATVIASGHGPRTTVGRERAANPFLR